jgi:hypothetical protein
MNERKQTGMPFKSALIFMWDHLEKSQYFPDFFGGKSPASKIVLEPDCLREVTLLLSGLSVLGLNGS